MKLIKFAAAALLTLSSLSASAGLISIVDNGNSLGQYQTIPTAANNNFTQPGLISTPDSKYTVAGSLKANGKLKVTYYYIGKEASWTNLFSVPGSAEAALGGSTNLDINKGTITTIVEKDSLFDFAFNSPNKGVQYTVTNAQGAVKLSNNRYYSFAVALNSTYTASAGAGWNENKAHADKYDAILFLDDSAGVVDGVAKDDDNHDDLVIGVKVTAVPEPTTLLLMSMGLLGLFGARRLKA